MQIYREVIHYTGECRKNANTHRVAINLLTDQNELESYDITSNWTSKIRTITIE